MKKFFVFSSAVIIWCFTFPAILLAAGNINFGNLKIIPAIEGQVIYDSNIFFKNGKVTPTDNTNKVVSDTIYHVKPGLLLNYDIPERGSAKLGWTGDWAFYNTETPNNWKNNNFSLGLDYTPPAGLIVGVNEEFRFKEDPYGAQNQYNLGRVTKRWENDLKSKLGVAWGNNTFRTLLLYNLFKQKYASDLDITQNYTNSEYGVSAEARFLPRTWGFARYLYGVRAYDSLSTVALDNTKADSKYHQVNVGLNWDPGSKLSGELSVGYMWKKYDNLFDSFGASRTDRNTWVAATNVNFDATATTVLSLNVARTIRDIASDSRLFFEDTGVGFSIRQTVLTKFVLSAGLTASLNDYNDRQALPASASASDVARFTAGEKRSDWNYIANVGLDYNIREWLIAGIAYKYNRKTSNYEAFEFDDNQYLASLKIVY